MQNQLSLYSYLKNTLKYKQYKGTKLAKKKNRLLIDPQLNVYDFDSTMDYYDNREENEYVGIIDKESARRKNKRQEELSDVFKIRERRNKILEKKRGTGIPSFTGAVCSTSKSRKYLKNLAKSINAKLDGDETRIEICNKIKERLLFLEKYSVGKKKLTYVMIPSNHQIYEFPYNLEDRVLHLKNKIKEKIKFNIDLSVKIKKQNVGKYKNLPKYVIKIKDGTKLAEFNKFLKSLKFELIKGYWTIILK
jgi:hypothetical protein